MLCSRLYTVQYIVCASWLKRTRQKQSYILFIKHFKYYICQLLLHSDNIAVATLLRFRALVSEKRTLDMPLLSFHLTKVMQTADKL